MARDEEVTVNAKTVTELTNADLTGGISWQNTGGNKAKLIGTNNATAPTIADFSRGFDYLPGKGETVDSLSEIFKGQSYVRLWAYSVGGTYFTVYHA